MDQFPGARAQTIARAGFDKAGENQEAVAIVLRQLFRSESHPEKGNTSA